VGGVTTVALGAALGFLMTSVTEQLPGRGLQADFGWNGGGVVSGLPQPRQAEPAGLAGPIGATNIPTGSTGTATGSAGIPTGSASIPTGPTGVPIINQLKSGA
jgi:hypothetical protein